MSVLTTDPRGALAAWEHQPDTTILTNGLWYVVGAYPVIANGREDWYQTSPEELDVLLRREESHVE